MIRNVRRQPKCGSSTPATRGNAITPPIEAPPLKIAIAIARSFCGNHSAITFAAPGQFPASPNPRKNEQTAKLTIPTRNACAIAATHHTTIDTLNPIRAPNRSYSRPLTLWLIVYASNNKLLTYPYCRAVTWMSGPNRVTSSPIELRST